MKIPEKHLSILGKIADSGDRRSLPVYIVGGVIRDTLLGRPSLDFDLMVEGDGISFAKDLATEFGCSFKEYPQFFTAKLQEIPDGIEEIDIASAREEEYPKPGALPIVRPSKITTDLARRDFTINAMCLPLSAFIESIIKGDSIRPFLIDPYNGCVDLDAKCVRILHDRSFIDDPTRIFRGARYAARIRGDFEANTLAHAKKAVDSNALATVSFFRIGNELRHIIQDDTAADALRILSDLGVFLSLGFGGFEVGEVVHKIELVKSASAKSKLQFSKIELPVLVYFLTNKLETLQREKIFNDWGFGKKGVFKTTTILQDLGVEE